MKGAFFAGLAVAGLSCAAAAQTVYMPVRYQYGQHDEVFYGGRAPNLTSGVYVYPPQDLAAGIAALRYAAPVYPYPSPFTPYGAGAAFVSPYVANEQSRQPVQQYIFSDYVPYEEVGQFGFTIDDARNEAYANVPRIQRKDGAEGEVSAYQTSAPVTGKAARVAAPVDHRADAIPLLDWAKVERGKNPPLYRALLQQAEKFDPVATAAFERKMSDRK